MSYFKVVCNPNLGRIVCDIKRLRWYMEKLLEGQRHDGWNITEKNVNLFT